MRRIFSQSSSRKILGSPQLRIICCGIAAALVLSLFISAPATGGLFVPPWDKLAHFLFFGTIAFLLAVGLGRSRWISALSITCLIGIADETYQLSLPGRQADFRDLAVDIFAAVTVVLIVRRFLASGDRK